ncbi:MAG: MFS transporter [Maricaulaceae bacterium]
MALHKNTLAVIIAVSMVSAIGGLVFNTMPLLLNAVSTALGLSPEQLGNLSLCAGIGYLVGTLTAPLWVERVNWRRAAFVIIVLAALSFVSASQVGANLLFVSFTAFAFFCALAIALAMRVLADMPDPERAFGMRLSVELISIGVFLGILPAYFIAKSGLSGAMFGLAGFTVLLGLGAFLIPERSTSVAAAQSKGFPSWAQASRSWLMLGVFLIYLLANVGLFFFLAVIAEDFKPSPEQFGVMFSVLKWLGGGAGLLGAVIGARAGVKLPHLAALIILLIGVAGLFLAKTFTHFMIASWVWEFGFTLGCLYQTAAIARFDISNKLVVLVPAVFGVSMLLGGKIAGQLLEGGSAAPLYILVAVCSLLPSLYVLSLRNTHSANT